MKKNLLAILLIGISLVGCKSYSALEKTPTAQLPAKLPAMELILDEQSFATVTGYENHESTGVAVASGWGARYSTVAYTGSSTKSYASSDLNNIKSLFLTNMYNNIVTKIGEKRGKVVCRLVAGKDKPNYGFTVLSSCLLFVPNLFGMPFGSNSTTMLVEMDFLDAHGNVVATYQSKQHQVKKYLAMYWGYEDPSEVTIAETFKLCLEDLNIQIKGDYAQLSQYFN